MAGCNEIRQPCTHGLVQHKDVPKQRNTMKRLDSPFMRCAIERLAVSISVRQAMSDMDRSLNADRGELSPMTGAFRRGCMLWRQIGMPTQRAQVLILSKPQQVIAQDGQCQLHCVTVMA